VIAIGGENVGMVVVSRRSLLGEFNRGLRGFYAELAVLLKFVRVQLL